MEKAFKECSFASISCFNHTLQLVILHALKTKFFEDSLTKCRQIVSHFHHSAQSSEKLEKIQKQLNIPTHKLILDCPTRWNSIYQMMKRLNEQKLAINATLPETMCKEIISAGE